MNIAGCSRENMPKMTSPIPRIRLNTPNFPGQDLVNKFIAATPSYMYSPIAGQHTFYFSELLRSLSQAKKAELINISREAVVQQQQQQQQSQQLQVNRKAGRKRGWSQVRQDGAQQEVGGSGGISDRPLELTSKHSAFIPRCTSPIKKSESPVSDNANNSKQPRFDENKRETKSASPEVEVTDSHSPGPNTNTLSNAPSDMILPPVPPAWYPTLYPPYGLDPANFFVDLRVSGHIFDRKRELAAQALKTVVGINNNNNNNLPSYFDNDFPKARSGSAFSIPKSREMKTGFTGNVINLSASDNRSSPTSQENVEVKCDTKHAGYVMHVDAEGKPKKIFDNGITVYNVDDSDDNTSGCKKQEESNSDSDDDENIRVDIN